MALVASLDSGVVRHIEVAPGEILHTTVIGSGEPVVLIPGIFGGAYGSRKITAPLVRRGYQCIVVEPLGYGRSSHPRQGASIAMRLAVANPKMLRGVLSISGGPAETAATLV